MKRELAPIADRLSKLLRMLTSDRDGEVVAAARSINRTLKNAGLDIHALADGITADKRLKFSEADARKIYDERFTAGRKEAERRRDVGGSHNVNDDEPSWHAIACECQAKARRLRGEREREFVADMVRRTVLGGELTERQGQWLRDIYVRIRR